MGAKVIGCHMDRIEVACRNCDHKQGYNIMNNIRPSADESIAVCRKCGFKSVWLYPVNMGFSAADIKELANRNNGG